MKNVLIVLCLFFTQCNTSNKKIEWVAIGDSITYLNEHTDEAGNRISKGYMTMATEQLPNLTYINKGYNGWTSKGIAEKFNELDIPKADVYSIFLGTNDWWQGRPLGTIDDYIKNTGNETVNGSFKIIIDSLKTLNNNATIILITPMPRTDFVYLFNFKNNAKGSYEPKNNQELAAFCHAIKEIGKVEKIDVLDLHSLQEFGMEKLVNFKRLKNPETGEYQNYRWPEYTSIPFNAETDEYPYPDESVSMTYDGLHPSEEGYQVITQHLIPLLKKATK